MCLVFEEELWPPINEIKWWENSEEAGNTFKVRNLALSENSLSFKNLGQVEGGGGLNRKSYLLCGFFGLCKSEETLAVENQMLCQLFLCIALGITSTADYLWI
jgi:hypothetical protein